MDVLSHGLWGAIGVGRKSKKDFLLAFLFGVFPDVFSFGTYWLAILIGLFARLDWSEGYPSMEKIPPVIHLLYNFSHSLVIFIITFTVVFLIKRKIFWPLGAWGIHILVDIPTHSFRFFPTPFLWPISNFKIDGVGWGAPKIFFTNWVLLFLIYAWFLIALYRSGRPTKVKV